jgi:hypothetical protein
VRERNRAASFGGLAEDQAEGAAARRRDRSAGLEPRGGQGKREGRQAVFERSKTACRPGYGQIGRGSRPPLPLKRDCGEPRSMAGRGYGGPRAGTVAGRGFLKFKL